MQPLEAASEKSPPREVRSSGHSAARLAINHLGNGRAGAAAAGVSVGGDVDGDLSEDGEDRGAPGAAAGVGAAGLAGHQLLETREQHLARSAARQRGVCCALEELKGEVMTGQPYNTDSACNLAFFEGYQAGLKMRYQQQSK
eukprot:gene2031-2353_t